MRRSPVQVLESTSDPKQRSQKFYDQLLELSDFIARRPWISLASAADYFGPLVGLNLTKELPLPSLGDDEINPYIRSSHPVEYTPFFDPVFKVPNDFVFRCLERRVEHWVSQLDHLRNKIRSALKATTRVSDEEWDCVDAVGQLPSSELTELRQMWCDSPQTEERLAAVRMVQIHAAYHPDLRFDWLNEANALIPMSQYFREQIERRNNRQILEVIACSLKTLQEFHHRMTNVESDILSQVQTHRLCLIEGRYRRDVYWNGNLLKIDWCQRNRAWILFSAMVENACQSGQGVDNLSDLKISLRDARRDLSNLLSSELVDLIIGSSEKALRLDLSCSAIFYNHYRTYEILEDANQRYGFSLLSK